MEFFRNVNVSTVQDDFEALQKASLDGDTLLHSAVRGSNMPVVKYLVEEKNLEINTENQNLETPLCIAKIMNDSPPLINYLENKNGTYSSERCQSTVEQAVKNGDLELLKYFIEKDVSNANDATLFDKLFRLAIEFNRWNIANYFVQKKAEMGLQWGTLLHAAVKKSNLELIKLMVENGADVDARDEPNYNETPLHVAAFNAAGLDVIKYLVENGADVNAKNINDRTALLFAAYKSSLLDVVKYLVEKGADVNAKDHKKLTPLHIAANYANLEIVRFLINNGADINAENFERTTPLHYAANKSSGLDVVKLLVEKGVSVNVTNSWYDTPLHVAARYSNFEIVKFLVDKGTDINAANSMALTPFDMAKDEQIKQYISSKGGVTYPRFKRSDRFLVGPHNVDHVLQENMNGLSKMTIDDLKAPPTKELSHTTQPFSAASQIGSSGGFLIVENLAFIGCIAETLNQSASKRFHRLKNQGINVIPNTNAAVYDARERFHEFVEEKIDTFGQEVQKVIRKELEKVDTDITESLMRGVEFSGLVGLDNVLEMCKQCFEDNLLNNVLDSGEV